MCGFVLNVCVLIFKGAGATSSGYSFSLREGGGI